MKDVASVIKLKGVINLAHVAVKPVSFLIKPYKEFPINAPDYKDNVETFKNVFNWLVLLTKW